MNYLLFTTTRCPKCPAFKELVRAKVPFEGQILDETTEDFGTMTEDHDVSEAPTFIVFEDGEEIFRTSDGGELEDFLEHI
ncbi:hypothetical protein K9M59_03495 [Candidatus Gracilibacteria bacterium]|nr:hypothetical protein [Candidatus Gracilibacteria bacterium]MCF7819391.1 hypothetical protein [Candidatus Gracilibacteria bacterium]